MSPRSRIRNAKRGGASSRSEATRGPVIPPTPAPDIPDPLRELPPEAGQGIQAENRGSGGTRDLRQALMEAGESNFGNVAKRQPHVTKKSGTK
jgi:hypothetical protein